MDDPGTLIYVAFLVISLIAGWLKNRKKTAAQPEMENPTMDAVEQIDLEEILREQKEKERQDAEARERLAEHAFKSEKKVKRNVKQTADLIETESTEKEEAEESWLQNLTRDFDARKAIIYSEILKRPEL